MTDIDNKIAKVEREVRLAALSKFKEWIDGLAAPDQWDAKVLSVFVKQNRTTVTAGDMSELGDLFTFISTSSQ